MDFFREYILIISDFLEFIVNISDFLEYIVNIISRSLSTHHYGPKYIHAIIFVHIVTLIVRMYLEYFRS